MGKIVSKNFPSFIKSVTLGVTKYENTEFNGRNSITLTKKELIDLLSKGVLNNG